MLLWMSPKIHAYSVCDIQTGNMSWSNMAAFALMGFMLIIHRKVSLSRVKACLSQLNVWNKILIL